MYLILNVISISDEEHVNDNMHAKSSQSEANGRWNLYNTPIYLHRKSHMTNKSKRLQLRKQKNKAR